jgi:hypothetical protein
MCPISSLRLPCVVEDFENAALFCVRSSLLAVTGVNRLPIPTALFCLERRTTVSAAHTNVLHNTMKRYVALICAACAGQ